MEAVEIARGVERAAGRVRHRSNLSAVTVPQFHVDRHEDIVQPESLHVHRSAAFRAVMPMTTINWHLIIKHQPAQDIERCRV